MRREAQVAAAAVAARSSVEAGAAAGRNCSPKAGVAVAALERIHSEAAAAAVVHIRPVVAVAVAGCAAAHCLEAIGATWMSACPCPSCRMTRRRSRTAK